MRTLHLIGSKTLGGAENWFFRFTSALSRTDHIEVIRGVRKGSELERVSPPSFPTYGLPFYTVWDPFSRAMVSRLVRELSPEIVQTYMGRATRLTHIPRGRGVVHVARLGGYYKLHAYTHAHAWIGNTRGVCDYLIKGGFPPERVFYISNFVEIPQRPDRSTLVEIKRELSIPEHAFVLLCVGRFVPVKGHRDLLHAISLLAARRKVGEFVLIMVGDGPLRHTLERMAQEMGIDPFIRWAGWREDVSPFYELAHLVVFPSHYEETLGNVILEAWAHKRAVVCSRFKGALEMTSHEEDVFQVSCGDTKGLSQAIEVCMRDDALRERLGEEGFKKVCSHFNPAKIIEEYISLYEYLLLRG